MTKTAKSVCQKSINSILTSIRTELLSTVCPHCGGITQNCISGAQVTSIQDCGQTTLVNNSHAIVRLPCAEIRKHFSTLP